MSKCSREKIALLVFVLLVLFAGACLVGYLVAGHSWNVAATNIDDTFGSMEGYTVIAYAGTMTEDEIESSTSTSKDESKKTPEEASADERAEADASADAGAGADESDGSVSSVLAGVSAGIKANADEAADATDEDIIDEDASVAQNSVSSSADADETSDNITSSEDEKQELLTDDTTLDDVQTDDFVSVSEVEESYLDKGATVFTLDTENPEIYSEGMILKKNDCRFGVFSVTDTITLRDLKRQVAYFEEYKVDFIVAIVPDRSYLKEVEGIDIVISTHASKLTSLGETQSSTYYVDAPLIGKVGAILISPSNVVSSKTL